MNGKTFLVEVDGINKIFYDFLNYSFYITVVSRSQIFRLTAEGLEYMAAFIGQGPPMRPFDQHVKQPIIVHFVQRHVSGRGNVATITNRCVKLLDLF